MAGLVADFLVANAHLWRWARLRSYRYHGKAAVGMDRCRLALRHTCAARRQDSPADAEVPFLEMAFPLSRPFIYLLFDAQNSEMGLLVL